MFTKSDMVGAVVLTTILCLLGVIIGGLFYVSESKQEVLEYDSYREIKYLDCDILYEILITSEPHYTNDKSEAIKYFKEKECYTKGVTNEE